MFWGAPTIWKVREGSPSAVEEGETEKKEEHMNSPQRGTSEGVLHRHMKEIK
jgi:hypothetical protein